MCGIAGFISRHTPWSADRLREAVAGMQHRGPDAEGFYFSADAKLALAHRRLSILDLSTAANQPLFSRDGRYCIVFNGEVYNYLELKQELPGKGAWLKTSSDTEVIVELFAREGTACFARLNGMFALAIYDLQEEKLTLCRDHVGIKPLFCYQGEEGFVFASELKVISRLLQDRLQLNPEAVPAFLHLGFIPGPATIYRNVWKFPAAHWLSLSTRQTNFSHCLRAAQPFWQLEQQLQAGTLQDEARAKEQLKTLLYDSVQRQLISDVPIGTFLSGGIDSSVVTAVAAAVTGSRHIKTFSIAIDDGRYNESPFAKAVAAHLHTDHHEFAVKEQEVLELVDRLLPAYDEPFADASAFPTMMVSRLARRQVTVALSGDGGDELFHGYGMYRWAERLAHPLIRGLRHPLYAASRLLGNRYERAGRLFDYPPGHIRSHIFSQEQYCFSERELQALLRQPAFDFTALNRDVQAPRPLTPAEQQSCWDFRYYLRDDLLVKVDRASMQYSLESRVPLLDYRLVEFAYNLSPALKTRNGQSKYLLKQVLFDHVPEALFRRPKWGFTIPLGKWLKGELKYLLDRYCADEVMERHQLLDAAQVKQLKKDYLGGKDYLYNRLWLIMVLHRWLEENRH